MHHISKNKILVLDETHIRENEAPTRTLVVPGQQPFVLATNTTRYALRFDMIACISFNKPFTPFILSPEERKKQGVRGIGIAHIEQYIRETLGKEIKALRQKGLVLLLDKASCHGEARLRQAFEAAGVQIARFIYIPTQGAKRLSALDNALFHDFKVRVQAQGPVTVENGRTNMLSAWSSIEPSLIRSHYRHAGLMVSCDPYADCPKPSEHGHST
jgi:hypothetical protein